MFFPLVSTLKLAILLQQQAQITTTTTTTTIPNVATTIPFDVDESNAAAIGIGANKNAQGMLAFGTTIDDQQTKTTSTALISAENPIANSHPGNDNRHGHSLLLPMSINRCWKTDDFLMREQSADERGKNDYNDDEDAILLVRYKIFQLECCAMAVPSSSSASSPSSSLTKCRLQIDFHQMLLCNRQTAAVDDQRRCMRVLLKIVDRIERRRKIGDGDQIEFSVSIGNWSGDSVLTSELFNAIRSVNVISLELSLLLLTERNDATNNSNDDDDNNDKIPVPNLGLFFQRLQQLSLLQQSAASMKRRTIFLGRTFLRDLPRLKSLKIVNIDVELDPKDAPQWVGQLERFHAQNALLGAAAGVTELPRWFPKCIRLERIYLHNCALNSSLVLSQLPSVVQMKVSNNRLTDVHQTAFKCARLYELDLRANGIKRIAPHLFARCSALRFLDLSDNPFGAQMPDKAFLGCQRLKQLRLERIGLMHLRAEMFVGLSNLKSMSLAGNAFSSPRIDPFTFLPTRSIRTLSMANCSLTTIPLAVTQCCFLNNLVLDDNRLADRHSMPSEVLALLSRLTHFSFQRNPLLQLPHGLFLLEPIGEIQQHKLADILTTLIHLPVWRLEPCTPYFWHFHLRNASSPELRRRVAPWNKQRMEREQLSHCQQLYETMLDGIGMYKELLENSGCEATRRLRSVRANKKHCAAAAPPPSPLAIVAGVEQKKTVNMNIDGNENEQQQQQMDMKSLNEHNPAAMEAVKLHPPLGIVRFMLAPATVLTVQNADSVAAVVSSNFTSRHHQIPMQIMPPTRTSPSASAFSFGLLHLSLGANFVLFAMALLLAMWKVAGQLSSAINSRAGSRMSFRHPKRSEFEEIC